MLRFCSHENRSSTPAMAEMNSMTANRVEKSNIEAGPLKRVGHAPPKMMF